MTSAPILHRSCGAVVYRDTEDGPRYLLLRYRARHWDFPKGHVEAGETEEDTVRRETREETGIDDLEFIPGFRTKIRYGFDDHGRAAEKEVTFLLARTKADPQSVRISDEHIGFDWQDYRSATRKVTYDTAKKVLKMAHHHLLKQGLAR